MPTDSKWPLPAFHFEVRIDGTKYSFKEVTGLEHSSDVLEYRTGDMKSLVKMKRLGLQKGGTIVLKRGIRKAYDKVLGVYKELEKNEYHTFDSTVELQIFLLDALGAPIMEWNIAKAVPIKFSGPNLKSDSNEIAIESIEFAHDGIETKFS
jgi:phage tail-like protein